MNICFYYNTKVTKLFIGTLMLFVLTTRIVSQEEDPISEAILEEKQKEDYLGPNLGKNEFEDLNKIYAKYQLTERQKELRMKQQKGERLSMMDKMRLGMANRKEYMQVKKIDKFYKKKLINKQSPEMRERMKTNEKKANRQYKKAKKKQKRKSFFYKFR